MLFSGEKRDSSCLQHTEYSGGWIKVYVFHNAVALSIFPPTFYLPHIFFLHICVVRAQNDHHILGYIKCSVASRSRELFCPTCIDLVQYYQGCCTQLWYLQHKKDMNLLKQVHKRVIKMTWVMEHLSCGNQGDSWDCSDWRKEGSGKILVWPFITSRGLKRKIETDILIGPITTGRGAVFLN